MVDLVIPEKHPRLARENLFFFQKLFSQSLKTTEAFCCPRKSKCKRCHCDDACWDRKSGNRHYYGHDCSIPGSDGGNGGNGGNGAKPGNPGIFTIKMSKGYPQDSFQNYLACNHKP